MQAIVIDDDPDILDLVSFCVKMRWPHCGVSGSTTGEGGLSLTTELSADLAILDLGLPDLDGIEVLRRLRAFSNVPVIVLSARDRDVDIARLLEEGADDYVVKPFSYVEMLGRIQAVLRRTHGQVTSASNSLRAGDLLMDFASSQVSKAGEVLNLTHTELGILEQLARNSPRVVTYQSLSFSVLGASDCSDEEVRLLRVHISNLRTKLGDSSSFAKYIANVRGAGYRFLLPVVSALDLTA